MRRRFNRPKKITEAWLKLSQIGDSTFTVPSGCTFMDVYVVGGGGGGGKTGHAGGGGGGGGQVVHQSMTVIPGQQIKVYIGKGGIAASYGRTTYSYIDGTNGEDSSFGDIVAKGGDFGGSAHGSYSCVGGLGGEKYTKGGDGADAPRGGSRKVTPGINGTLINGDYYGSSGGAGNYYHDYYGGPGSSGGVNAGNGKTLYDWRDENDNFVLGDSKALDSFGGGGGATCPEYDQYGIISGGSGCVLLKCRYYK